MRRLAFFLVVLASAAPTSVASAQTFGVELHNTLMPASGAMGGASTARPQDLTSALNGNPATLTQFRGSQFLFGTGWVEPTFNLTQTSNIPVVGPSFIEPFSAKSSAPGTPVGNIGVAQELRELGLPVTVGTGLITSAGGFADFRQVPESRGTNAREFVLSVPTVVGVDLTDRLALGARLALGIAFYDAPFVAVEGMTVDYALRGTVGASYLLSNCTTIGAYYQTEQSFKFDNAVVSPLGARSLDINVGLPTNFGWGIADNRFMNGNLLLAVDILYKLWDDTPFYGSVYDNQWVVQLGSQLTRGRFRFRAGYVWAENPIAANPQFSIGGFPLPSDLASLRYAQALTAITNQHRMSFGVGVADILPGVDLDFMAGGMFRTKEQLGPFSRTSLEGYWIGLGVTWRFGRGSCHRLPAPDSWCETSAAYQ